LIGLVRRGDQSVLEHIPNVAKDLPNKATRQVILSP